MGNYCCTQKEQQREVTRVSIIRSKSLKDPVTKQKYQKTLQYILNLALQKFQQQYEIKGLKLKGLLGKGGQASVFQVDVLCKRNDEEVIKKFAMKRVSKYKLDRQKTRKALLLQKQILVSNPSPFITQIQFACQDQAYLYFFMKLAQGGDSFSLIKNPENLLFSEQKNYPISKATQFEKLGEQGIVFILASVVLGLQSLHKLNIIYRDLKPQNILLFSDGYPKLADFGVALKQQEEDELFYQMKGTILYFAPQMLSRKGYDKSVDFWALGVLAFEFLFKEPPFSPHIIQSSIFQIKIRERLEKKLWPSSNISQQMKDFINKLLIINPKQRLGYNNIDQIKNHKVFQKINWKEFQKRKMTSPLVEIISQYPAEMLKQSQIDEIIDHSQFQYIPFTFVRSSQKQTSQNQEKKKPKFIIDRPIKRKVTFDDEQTNNSRGFLKINPKLKQSSG